MELDLLQRSGDSLLESSVNDHNCRGIKADGEQLLSLTQVGLNTWQGGEEGGRALMRTAHLFSGKQAPVRS